MPSSSSSGRAPTPPRTTPHLRRGVAAAAVLSVGLALALLAGGPDAKPPEQATKGFDGARFSTPATIDNRWLPLVPGTQFVLQGRANRGQGRRPHRVVFTVTDLTKVVDGVRTRVLWDRDDNGGRLLEGELAFHAQDDDGNVWNFGEYPEQYERGKLVGAPDTWIAGLAGARAGILMPARPRPRTASYLQGWAPAIHFADRARVARIGQRTCVPLRCYRNVLVTDEWNPSEPGEHQLKSYAPGVGNIRVGAAGGREHEELVLVRVAHLRPKGLAEVRRQALRLERRAYTIRKDLYGLTPPARRDGR